ncbi:MAG: HYR domain-containing protein, partial [Merismopedia sp. SIO2A8]|nr:HYR domain-containing protein [Merismopedia sp. SIO2A8]
MPATITRVSATQADGNAIATNGHYKAGVTITIEVEFSESVTVEPGSGTPTLALETGDTDQVATYVSGSGTDILKFQYTIQEGDDTSALDYASESALSLNGRIIQSGGEDAILTLPTVGTENSIAGSNTIVVDTEAPTFDIDPDGVAMGETARPEPGASVGLAEFEYLLEDALKTDNYTDSNDLVLTTPSQKDGDLFPIGTTTLEYTLTDRAGNSATDVILITVYDRESPTIVVPNTFTIFLGEDGTRRTHAGFRRRRARHS